jgi:DNA-binding transcriptional ArsR family regulator
MSNTQLRTGNGAAPTGDATPAEPVDLDDVFDVLGNARRRAALRRVAEGSALSQGELAEAIAAEENGVPIEAVTAAQRKRVYVSLYQAHLPRLDEAGAIAFDRHRGSVEPGPRMDTYLSYLERCEAVDGSGPASRSSGTRLRLAAGVGVGVGLCVGAVAGAVLGPAGLALGGLALLGAAAGALVLG